MILFFVRFDIENEAFKWFIAIRVSVEAVRKLVEEVGLWDIHGWLLLDPSQSESTIDTSLAGYAFFKLLQPIVLKEGHCCNPPI